jgi:hypothetical protein
MILKGVEITMETIKIITFVGGILLLGMWGCDSPTDEGEAANRAVLNGRVVNSEGAPIDRAIIQVLNVSPLITIVCDSVGKFSIELELENAQEIQLAAFKESYVADTTEVLAVPGEVIVVPIFELAPTESSPSESGGAAVIILHSQSAPSIGVRESGAEEAAALVFEAQDSLGRPVDLDHTIEMRFRFGSAPGGGEFIHPLSAPTGNNGHATTYLFSGTRAGVVQIIAEATLGARTIRSQPVAIVIHGGLPDAAHFSVATEKVNFPGYNIFGRTNGITAFVGDKYSNPVRPGTSVSFATTGGIIEGSAQTNSLGEASVNLLSAAPRPSHPILGPGFATITATTANENQNAISTEVIVLFSGVPQISISPTSFAIPNGGSQSFIYTVSDQNSNPLAEGTSITVSVSGENVKTFGKLNYDLPDTQSRSWTQFGFTVADAADTVDVVKPLFIDINAEGPNGEAFISIFGTSR